MKWEAPAFASVSSREPAPIQNPSATERTLGTRSEMTRSPESSSERTYFCTRPIIAGRRALLEAERIPFQIAHDRPGSPGFRLGSSTVAPSAVRRSISAPRSSARKSRWIG